jgi:hypothetical protein
MPLLTSIVIWRFLQNSINLSTCTNACNILSAKHINLSLVKFCPILESRTQQATINSSTSFTGETFWWQTPVGVFAKTRDLPVWNFNVPLSSPYFSLVSVVIENKLPLLSFP